MRTRQEQAKAVFKAKTMPGGGRGFRRGCSMDADQGPCSATGVQCHVFCVTCFCRLRSVLGVLWGGGWVAGWGVATKDEAVC